MTSHRHLEELLYHMRTIAQLPNGDWAAGFARSILRSAKRRGWKPTHKQRAIMQRLVAEMFVEQSADQEFDLIEEKEKCGAA